MSEIEKLQREQMMDYATALQRAIEYACRGEVLPEDMAAKCPHHAEMINTKLSALIREREKAAFEAAFSIGAQQDSITFDEWKAEQEKR